jgi:NADH-quinone oxidoreductase subunit L
VELFRSQDFGRKDEILGAAYARGGAFGYALWAIGIFTALLTAFYMTRQVRMVFYGEPRYGETEHPPHESPKAMTIPLIILAALSVVVGLINIPIHSAEHLKKFLEPAFLGADEIKIATIDSSRGGTLALISLLVALAGIGLGIWVYKKRPTSATDEPLSRLGSDS